MLPLGCLPHWGREGVTLVFSGIFPEVEFIFNKRLSLKHKFLYYSSTPTHTQIHEFHQPPPDKTGLP